MELLSEQIVRFSDDGMLLNDEWRQVANLECDQETNVGDLINFKKTKKRIERERSAIEASENRAKFGRTKAERKRQRISEERSTLFLDKHRRNDGEPS